MSDLEVLPPEPAKPAPAEQLPFTSTAVRATEKVEIARAATQVMQSFNRADLRPRDEQLCYQRIMQLCENVYFASDALYSVPRGGGRAEGISVKAATEFARIWGNLDCGYVEHGRYDGASQFEAYCYDLESNYRFRNAFTVAHERQSGDKINKVFKPQEVDELCKARASKEVRNAILKVLPHYIAEEAEKACKRTMFREAKDIPTSWKSCSERFAQLGVQENSLFRYVNKQRGKQVPLEQITAADIVDLRVAYQSIKDDPSCIDDYFPERDKSKVQVPAPKPAAEQKAAPPKQSKEAATNAGASDTASATSKESATSAESSNAATQTNASGSQEDSAPKSSEAGTQATQPEQSAPSAAPAETSSTSEASAESASASSEQDSQLPPPSSEDVF